MKNVDLVVPWVDGNDPKWQEEKNTYKKYRNTNPGFYQDWGWMRYWFRCVEKNIPWIRYIFFITYGHTPEWLNLNHPKLKIINHKDYMPPEFLPTFSSIPINMNIHRINELSETFIYAEDDIFFIGEQNPDDFFSNVGLPKDYLWLRPITEQFQGDYIHLMLNNILIIKKHFDMQYITQKGDELLFASEYPEEVIIDNKKYQTLKYIPGFKEPHTAYSFLKSSFEQLWSLEGTELYKVSMHRFKTIADITIALVRQWQLASGNFSPKYPKGRYYTDVANPNLQHLILSEDTKMLCINESEKQRYSKERADEICSYFEQRFPERSLFEMD